MRKWLDRPRTAWILGVALPPLMLVFDPIVFRSAVGMDSTLLGHYKASGYVGIALGVGTLAWCLSSRRASAVASGALAAGCVLAIGVGLAILPYSLPGIILFGIGLLGFSPFATAFVLGGWSRRVYAAAPAPRRTAAALSGFVLFAAITVGSQVAASSAYQSAVDDILSGGPSGVERGGARLAQWQLLLDLDEMVRLWSRQDQAGRERLATAYRRVTGTDISTRGTVD